MSPCCMFGTYTPSMLPGKEAKHSQGNHTKHEHETKPACLPLQVFAFAQDMLATVSRLTLPTTGGPVQIRVGIHRCVALYCITEASA